MAPRHQGWFGRLHAAAALGELGRVRRSQSCRYELRRAASGPTMDLWHWGVSAAVEGGFDEQRGTTRRAAENIATRRPSVTFASFSREASR